MQCGAHEMCSAALVPPSHPPRSSPDPHWPPLQELCGWLREYSSRSDSLYGLVCDYLESGADWRRLCGVLLPLLPPADLLGFASGLLDDVPLPPAAAAAGTAGAAAAAAAVAVGTPGMPPSPPPGAFLVLRGACWGSLEALLVAAAVGCSLRQLGRLVREEENGQELQVRVGWVLWVWGDVWGRLGGQERAAVVGGVGWGGTGEQNQIKRRLAAGETSLWLLSQPPLIPA